MKEPDFNDIMKTSWKNIDGYSNSAEAWVMNLGHVRAVIKSWAFRRKMDNRELKDKLLRDIDILDKEEVVDLTSSEV